MYTKAARRAGFVLIFAALALRLLQSAVLPVTANSEEFTRLTLALSTGTRLTLPPAGGADAVWVLKKTVPAAVTSPASPEPTVTAPVYPAFTAQDAETLKIGGKCTYTVDKSALLLSPLLQKEPPAVLIVHTHTSEAYSQTAGWFYEESETLRTLDNAQNVTRVGQELAAVLEQRGIRVYHDTTCNDYPNYNKSYTNTAKVITRQLEAHPEISLVLDLHRDALENTDGTLLRNTAVLADGRTAAKLMLVVGTDQGGGANPRWKDNLSLALKLQCLLERENPGLCRNIDLRTERFNQHLADSALLVEVGATGNTLPEALISARLLADAVADLLVGYN